MATSAATRTAYRTCPLCEATCGLELTLTGRRLDRVRGDPEDVFSRGYLCPKGAAIKDLEADPDRLRQPVVRRGDRWQRVSWDDAFDEVAGGLRPIIDAHGPDAVAVYVGNPNAHNLGPLLYSRAFLRALGSRNVYSAGTVDGASKQLAVSLMFGTPLTFPIPDLDRTDLLVVLGADPLVSNGSALTAPNMAQRLHRLQERGGRIIVIDPRRSRTAAHADEHHFIRPGRDAHLLLGLVHVLFAEGLVSLGRLEPLVVGVDVVAEVVAPFTPEVVSPHCGVGADVIRRLARDVASAPRACVYGRFGTCTQEFGTLASWLVDVTNTLTGNLDREGGMMFPLPATGSRNTMPARRRAPGDVEQPVPRTRVRGLPQLFGEFPVSCLAEEIETPGEGRIRALVTLAGNPVVTTPNSKRLVAALSSLDFMVSVDIYRNETTRFADAILPPASLLSAGHYDLYFYRLAVRNVANYSPPVIEVGAGELEEWRILAKLALIAAGEHDADEWTLDDRIVTELVRRSVTSPGSAVFGMSEAPVLAALKPRRGPERLLDFMLRTGPYGDGFGADPQGLTLALLEAHPHGIDLGPLMPRLPEILRTASGKIELAPGPIVADVARLRSSLGERADGLVLVGRRHLRSNNSWMHNLELLARGRARCTLLIHPSDADSRGIRDGETVTVSSRVGAVALQAEVTRAIMPGVVSIPHGWGHAMAGDGLGVASRTRGVNSNELADELLLDVPSGNAVLNGLPVTVQPARSSPTKLQTSAHL